MLQFNQELTINPTNVNGLWYSRHCNECLGSIGEQNRHHHCPPGGHWKYNNEQGRCKTCSYEAYSLVAETDVNQIVTSVCNYRIVMNAGKEKGMSLPLLATNWKQPKCPKEARVAGVQGAELSRWSQRGGQGSWAGRDTSKIGLWSKGQEKATEGF